MPGQVPRAAQGTRSPQPPQGPRPPGPQGPQGPLGPPPQGRPGGTRQPPPGPGVTGWPDDDSPPPPTRGFFGALFNISFDHLITPKLIKFFYVLALILISLGALTMVSFGRWVAHLHNGGFLGALIMLGSPVAWLLQIVLVRLVMEAFIVHFKGVEYLRIMKDSTMKDSTMKDRGIAPVRQSRRSQE
ncbi:MAG TPA: DUF4282 domain-containing protein [Streptosporangiaceae bacterium]